MSCAKTDEPIDMPFEMWIRVGPKNHALGGGPNPPEERAILKSTSLRCSP